MNRRRAAFGFAALAAAGWAAALAPSCARPATPSILASTPTPEHVAPAAPAATRAPASALHAGRLHRLTETIFAGPRPRTDADFDHLARLGVRTIISVDAATPGADLARRRGMRYVHLPVGFRGITPAQQARIARAVRDLPRPVYLHCLDGLHRAPAAAASAAVLLGESTPDDAVRFLQQAGVSPSYPGLWSCVRQAATLPRAAVDRASADFPEIAAIPTFVRTMVEVNAACENLRLLSAASWTAPADHPDLDPAAEAARLADLLRTLRHDPRTTQEGGEFRFFLLTSADHAHTLHQALISPHPPKPESLNQHLHALTTSCRDCHVRFRNH